MLVRLIGDHDQIMLNGHLRDPLQCREIEHSSGRIMGRIHHHDLGTSSDLRPQLFDVNPKMWCSQGNRDADRASHRDAGRIRIVVRLEQNAFITGIEQRQQCCRDGFGGPGRYQNFSVGIDRQSVVLPLMVTDGGAQLGDARAGRVLVAPARPNRLHSGFDHLRRTIGIGKTLPQIDRPSGHRQGRHFREDRGTEPLEFGVEKWDSHAPAEIIWRPRSQSFTGAPRVSILWLSAS